MLMHFIVKHKMVDTGSLLSFVLCANFLIDLVSVDLNFILINRERSLSRLFDGFSSGRQSNLEMCELI